MPRVETSMGCKNNGQCDMFQVGDGWGGIGRAVSSDHSMLATPLPNLDADLSATRKLPNHHLLLAL
jgi:hypothetical protein